VVTYQIRADLKETDPPTWRGLEVASDANLAEVHDVLQVAFGWTDSHLHGFAAGPEFDSADAEHYLCPFDEEEGEQEGVPEEQVRLDEVLAEAGDTLAYTYDYGDGWDHLITLEAALPRPEGAPRAMCTGGERDGPAEDCGGVGNYELIAAATDPARPDHAVAKHEFAEMFGDEVDPGNFQTTPLDINDINAAMKRLGPNPVIDVAGLPVPLGELLGAVRSTDGLRTLRQLIAAAELASPVQVDAETARQMARPYTWLLERVGTGGIKLTSAGYLPPGHVAAAFAELGLAEEWIGRGNREADTWPVLRLRESAQKLGLLRKHRGELLCTARGRALRDDPVGLWWHLAERIPAGSADPFASQAALLFLAAIAGNLADDLGSTVASILGSIGWRLSDGTPPTSSEAFMAVRDTWEVLRRIGAITGERFGPRSETPTPEGVLFTRASLRTWPKQPRSKDYAFRRLCVVPAPTRASSGDRTEPSRRRRSGLSGVPARRACPWWRRAVPLRPAQREQQNLWCLGSFCRHSCASPRAVPASPRSSAS
jgi:Plasmid pRiA4b ORF-3-like protein